jgi:hypothetical protein
MFTCEKILIRDSLLAQSHSLTLHNWLFKFVSKYWRLLWQQKRLESSARLLWQQKRLESSANKWKSISLAQLLNSFIYNKNNNGPSTDPWGMAQVIPRRRREAPCEGTNSPRLFTPGETKALAKSKVHQILRVSVTNGVEWVVILTDLKNMADCL